MNLFAQLNMNSCICDVESFFKNTICILAARFTFTDLMDFWGAEPVVPQELLLSVENDRQTVPTAQTCYYELCLPCAHRDYDVDQSGCWSFSGAFEVALNNKVGFGLG